MMYDALFTYEKFVAKLPDSYTEFANAWKKSFGPTYDTKILAKHIIEKPGDKIFSKT